jgi:hypothetical protein
MGVTQSPEPAVKRQLTSLCSEIHYSDVCGHLLEHLSSYFVHIFTLVSLLALGVYEFSSLKFSL